MERKQISSSAISEVGYDPATETLEVLFPSKALWRYFGVQQQTYDDFMRAESLGRFFATNIRANFKSERVHVPLCVSPHVPDIHPTICPCWCHNVRKEGSHGEIPNPSLEKDLKKSIKAANKKKSA